MHPLMMALRMLTNHDSEEGCGFAVAMVPRPQSLAAWPAILVDVGATEDRQSLCRLFVCDLHKDATCA